MSRSQRPPPDQPIGFPADVVDATSQWQALLLNPHHPAVQALIQARAALASDTRPLALAVADELDRFGHPAGHARAEFIRRQCAGELAEDLFADCASWGIPAFREGILAAGDFREGFLARFRDHTTSWSDNHYAQIWWYTSPEARLTQHYELWTARDGAVAVHDQLDAPYQELLEQFVVWGLPGALEVLDCPSFTLADLRRFATDPAFAEAQEVLTEMLAEADRLPPDQAWLRRGEVHYRRGEPQPAISCLERAVQLQPDSWAAWYALGIANAQAAQHTQAVDSLTRAWQLAPGEPSPLHPISDPWRDIRMSSSQLAIQGQAIQRLGTAVGRPTPGS